MKKTLTLSGLTIAMICLLALAFSPAKASGLARSGEGNPELPDSVAKIVQKACIDCHSNDGNGMAKGKVNFDKWNTYDVKKQASKAFNISKQVSKSSMPPGKWRKNNPDNVPTPAETEVLKNWAKALNK